MAGQHWAEHGRPGEPISLRDRATKSEYDTLIRVAELRTCTVSYKDLQDIEHAVQVTAETLYEAAALGLAAFRKADLFGGGAPAGHAQ